MKVVLLQFLVLTMIVGCNQHSESSDAKTLESSTSEVNIAPKLKAEVFSELQAQMLDTKQVAITLVRNLSTNTPLSIHTENNVSSINGYNQNEFVSINLENYKNSLSINGYCGNKNISINIVAEDRYITVNGYLDNDNISFNIEKGDEGIHIAGFNDHINSEFNIYENANDVKIVGFSGRTNMEKTYSDKKLAALILMRFVIPAIF